MAATQREQETIHGKTQLARRLRALERCHAPDRCSPVDARRQAGRAGEGERAAGRPTQDGESIDTYLSRQFTDVGGPFSDASSRGAPRLADAGTVDGNEPHAELLRSFVGERDVGVRAQTSVAVDNRHTRLGAVDHIGQTAAVAQGDQLWRHLGSREHRGGPSTTRGRDLPKDSRGDRARSGAERHTDPVTEGGSGTRGALLLIDFQEDFLAPNGRMPVDQSQIASLLAAAQTLVEAAQASGDLIVKIGNEYRSSDLIGNLFRHHASMKGSVGSAWDGRIDPPGAAYFPKWKSNAFCNAALAAALSGARVDRVRLAGVYTKACVSATAKAARRQGLSVQVIGEATACSSDASRQTALDKLRRAGIDVV
jgi:nicotinamidase-related amidase